MTTGSFLLRGLDGANPLGFLAAVGALAVLSRGPGDRPRLRWARRHTWQPVLESVPATDEASLAGLIASRLRGRQVSAADEQQRAAAQRAMEAARRAVASKREELRQRGLRGADRQEALQHELQPLEEAYRAARQNWLEALRQAVPRRELALGARIDCTPEEYRDHGESGLASASHADRDVLDLLGAFGSDACRARDSAAIEATPFCFTTGSGHQNFLETVRELTHRVAEERVREALFQEWRYRDERLSLRWDPAEDRRYALLDRDPSDDSTRTVWMANLLAYHALALFPAAPSRRGLAVAGWSLEDQPPRFDWPLWEFPASLDVVRTLVQLPDLAMPRLDTALLRQRGIAAVYRTRRIEVGEAGRRKVNFTPARQV